MPFKQGREVSNNSKMKQTTKKPPKSKRSIYQHLTRQNPIIHQQTLKLKAVDANSFFF